jgi:hypothetical protein
MAGSTDIDLIVNGVYYQAKSTSGSFKSLAETQAWVAKAIADMGSSASYSKVKYVVPPGTSIPGVIDDFFRDNGIDVIRDIQHR